MFNIKIIFWTLYIDVDILETILLQSKFSKKLHKNKFQTKTRNRFIIFAHLQFKPTKTIKKYF